MVEFLKNRYNAVDETFDDAISDIFYEFVLFNISSKLFYHNGKFILKNQFKRLSILKQPQFIP